MKVYLAGGFYSGWRKQIADADLGIEIVDPEHDSNQTASYRFVHEDLTAIEQSDLVIAYYSGYPLHGMAAEMGYAVARMKVVYYIDTTSAPNLFLVGLSKRMFTSIEAFIEWWRQRVADGKPVL